MSSTCEASGPGAAPVVASRASEATAIARSWVGRDSFTALAGRGNFGITDSPEFRHAGALELSLASGSSGVPVRAGRADLVSVRTSPDLGGRSAPGAARGR